MGREIRQVTAKWRHPKQHGKYIPLFGNSFREELARWNKHKKKWDQGFMESFENRGQWVPIPEDYKDISYEDWDGEKPNKRDYMPEWKNKEKTHIQLYETTTEGTPISPVFAKKDFEKLCEYAATHCTTFGYFKAKKEEWYEMLKDDLVFHKEGNILFM